MINNPTDSVCDYLAELLYEGTVESEQNVIDAVKVTEEPSIPSGQKQVVQSNVKTTPQASVAKQASHFEDAPSFDKAKLAKLLRSAPLKVGKAAVRPVDIEPVVALPVREAELPVLEPAAAVAEIDEPALEETEPEPEPIKEIAWCENGRPSWAQSRFDVLLFKVHGLTLAVPLVALGQIQPITEELTPLFGQAKWFMGLQPTPMGQIKTVNTALFVMPERYDPAFLLSAKYVVSIDGLNWGLAVDSVQQPKTLDPDDVKWRQGRGLRPWLAGTIKEHMCALIDIPNMGLLLAASDRNSTKKKK